MIGAIAFFITLLAILLAFTFVVFEEDLKECVLRIGKKLPSNYESNSDRETEHFEAVLIVDQEDSYSKEEKVSDDESLEAKEKEHPSEKQPGVTQAINQEEEGKADKTVSKTKLFTSLGD